MMDFPLLRSFLRLMIFFTRHRRWVLLWSRHFPWLSATGTRGFVGCVPIFLVEGPKTEEKKVCLFWTVRHGLAEPLLLASVFFQFKKKTCSCFLFLGLTFPKWWFAIIFLYSYILQLCVGFLGTMKTSNIPTPGGASGRREKGRFGLALPGRPRVNSFKVFPW